MRVPLSPDETWSAACQQAKLLIDACRRFDDGDGLEYLNIAGKLRILLHDQGKNSHALLGQVGVLSQPIFVASGADITPENVLPESKLTSYKVGHETTVHIPRLNDMGEGAPRKMLPLHAQIHRLTHGIVVRDGGRGRAFDDWWNQPVIRDMGREEYTRSFVVLKVANQDGGSHVDPSLDARHYALTRQNSMGMFVGDEPLESPVPATIRQIGWEIHSMLWEHHPKMLELVTNPEPPLNDYSPP